MEPLVFETAVDLATETPTQTFNGHEHGVGASFMLVHMEPGRGPSLHRHAYPEVFIVADGEATFTVDGAEYVARGGPDRRRAGGRRAPVREHGLGDARADEHPARGRDEDGVAGGLLTRRGVGSVSAV